MKLLWRSSSKLQRRDHTDQTARFFISSLTIDVQSWSYRGNLELFNCILHCEHYYGSSTSTIVEILIETAGEKKFSKYPYIKLGSYSFIRTYWKVEHSNDRGSLNFVSNRTLLHLKWSSSLHWLCVMKSFQSWDILFYSFFLLR